METELSSEASELGVLLRTFLGVSAASIFRSQRL